MKQLIQSYYDYLLRNSRTANWDDFVYFFLDYSLPQLLSSTASILNLQKASPEPLSDPKWALDEGNTDPLFLSLYDSQIQREPAKKFSLLDSVPFRNLLENIRKKIRKLKKA